LVLMNVVHTSGRHVGPMSCGPCLAVAVPAATSRAAAAVAVLTVGAARRSEREVAGVSARLTGVIVRYGRVAALARAMSGMSALANRLCTAAAVLVRRLRGDGRPPDTDVTARRGTGGLGVEKTASTADGMRMAAASSGVMPSYRRAGSMGAAWVTACGALSGPLAVLATADELPGLPGAGEWLLGVPRGGATS
jgi:hypothetical protein